MRILFDQGTPAPLRGCLDEHEVSTAFELGWSTLRNGELIERADALFDVLITTDRNLRYQQNLSGRRIAILVLWTTSWPRLRDRAGDIALAIAGLKSGDYVELT